MASTYSPDLRIELIGNGQQTGIWGSTTNVNLGTLLEQAIAGAVSVTVTSAKQALVAYNGVEDQARSAAVLLSTSTGAAFEVYVPPVSKLYLIRNTSSYNATIYVSTVLGNTTAAGTGVVIPPSSSVLLRCDSTNVYEQLNCVVGDFSVGGNINANTNILLDGSINVSGSAYLGAAITVTISAAANPVVLTATSPQVAPINGAALRLTTTGTLPTPLDTTTIYYVINRTVVSSTVTTFNISTTPGGTGVATSANPTGVHTASTVSTASTPPAATNNTVIANTEYVTTAITNLSNTIGIYQTKTAVKAATTAAITLSGAQTIDGVSVVAEDRVLVKNQYSTSEAVTISIANPAVITTVGAAPANGTQVTFTTTGALPTGITVGAVYYVTSSSGSTYQLLTYGATTPVATSGTQSGTQTAGYLPGAANGIYVVKSGASPAWVRATDADTSAEIAAATVPVLQGTANGGKNFTTQFTAANTLGTTAMSWNELVDVNSTQTLQNKTINAVQLVNGSITAAKLSGGQSGLQPAYATRTWVNFNGSLGAVTTLNGSYSHAVNSPTITITQVSHGFRVGQLVYIIFVPVNYYQDWFIIQSVPTDNTFTITVPSYSSIPTAYSGTTTIRKAAINASGNVYNVVYGGIYNGVRPGSYALNFDVDMPDTYYSWSGAAGYNSIDQTAWITAPPNIPIAQWKSTKFLRVAFTYANAAYATFDPEDVNIQVIR
jgi:hypothetical protein